MKILHTNKDAYFNYNILETYQAGVCLVGDEVKSIRNGQGQLKDAFVTMQNGEAIIINWYIAPYSHAYQKKLDPRRSRVLLLNKDEIRKITGALSRKGLTAIPTKLYFSGKSWVKIEIGLAQHKKLVDKRRDTKDKDIKREAERELRMKIK